MTIDIESIIDRTELPETSVPLCLDGPLVAEYERLEVRLRDAGPATSLGDEGSAEVLAERMELLRRQMLAGRVWFRLRALPKPRWLGISAALPSKRDGQTDEEAAGEYHAWVCKLVAATCFDPAMTPEQADRLSQRLSDGQWSAIVNAAWGINTSRQDVPFSAAASAITRRSAGRSRRPEPSELPAPSSLAGSAELSPSTSTTTADV